MTEPVHNKKTAKNMLTIITFYPFTFDCRILSLLQTQENNPFTSNLRQNLSTHKPIHTNFPSNLKKTSELNHRSYAGFSQHL